MRVSIIGTAGRRSDGDKLSLDIYNRAIDKVKETISRKFGLPLARVQLVSGGAAWADHIAVALFLMNEVSQLTLHFPTEFLMNEDKPQFVDTGERDWRKNPGQMANTCHRNFSQKIKDDSLKQIYSAISIGANYAVHKGFHARNKKVAESPFLIALTWSKGNAPDKGGTLDTWTKCRGRKIHIPLDSIEVPQKPSELTEGSPEKSSSSKEAISNTDIKHTCTSCGTSTSGTTCTNSGVMKLHTTEYFSDIRTYFDKGKV